MGQVQNLAGLVPPSYGHISGHRDRAPINPFGCHPMWLIHLAYGHRKPFSMDCCCWCAVENWCDPGDDLDLQNCSLGGHKRCAMKTGAPSAVMNGRAAGSGKDQKPEL